MSNISEKTLIDLEFLTILQSVSENCISELGKNSALKIRPFNTKEALITELNLVNEYLSSYQNDNRLPNHYFDDIQKEIHLLNIENSYLEPASFLKISNNVTIIFELLKFLKKFKVIYPALYVFSEEIDYQKFITENINTVITSFAEVNENASVLLKQIRSEINSIRSKIGSSFTKALSKYSSAGYLDEIRESVVDNQRVLAVQAMYRRKVKGSLLGSSKTGSIVYIAPEATLQFSRELQNLAYEEHQEIVRILKQKGDIGEQKDGMDISIVSINEETKLCQYAGANNPLWIVRESELIETKANKQPVGRFSHSTPFTTHEIPLKKGDMIYIYSDGYQDQIGGDKSKRFMSSQLLDLIMTKTVFT